MITHPAQFLHGHHALARRMACTSELTGHHGCVNRLAFDDEGKLLLSGSDDCSLRIWSVEHDNLVVPKGVITPGHVDNIFGVAFMPNTGNSYVASAGLDQQVHLTNVETSKSLRWFCHTDSVKTVAPLDANVFITASKDGTSRLFDARIPPTSQNPSESSIIVVSVPYTNPYSNGINSAIPSPTFPNHILISSGEAFLRVFDLRFNACNRLNSPRMKQLKSHASCIESYCPSHLHDLSPERCSSRGNIQPAYVTFATFSPDANQIVASYYMDAVHVFDRRIQSPTASCLSGFRTNSEKKRVIWHFIQEASNAIVNGCVKVTIALANRVLNLEPNNILALLYKAESLLRRKNCSDFRVACECLQQIIAIVKEDPRSITALWGSDGPHLPQCFPVSLVSWQLKAEVWLMIFEFRQIVAMYRMIPHRLESPGWRPGITGLVTRRRFEYLRELCRELMERRSKFFRKIHPTNGQTSSNSVPPGYMNDSTALRAEICKAATGTEKEVAHLYKSRASQQRKQVLDVLADMFATRLNELFFEFSDTVADLPPHDGCLHGTLRMSSTKEVWRRIMDGEEVPERFARELKALEAAEKRLLEKFDSEVLWGVRSSDDIPCRRFHGHKSEQTDIKEARFFGSDNQVVLSGSDDGFVYIWSATTSEVLTRVMADEQIVNCVLPHPYRSMIIASGIDSTIKVLTPEGSITSTDRSMRIGSGIDSTIKVLSPEGSNNETDDE